MLTVCKTSACTWKRVPSGPLFHPRDIPSFLLNESEEAEGLFGESIGSSAGVTELTGVFRRDGCRGAEGGMGNEASEVVCLCYRLVRLNTDRGEYPDSVVRPGAGIGTPVVLTPTPATPFTAQIRRKLSEDPDSRNTVVVVAGSGSEDKKPEEVMINTPEEGAVNVVGPNRSFAIEGYLDWCERGARSRITGILGQEGVSLDFSISEENRIIQGPPDSLDWFRSLEFSGKVRLNLDRYKLLTEHYIINILCHSINFFFLIAIFGFRLWVLA